jgi:hypothetical protein
VLLRKKTSDPLLRAAVKIDVEQKLFEEFQQLWILNQDTCSRPDCVPEHITEEVTKSISAPYRALWKLVGEQYGDLDLLRGVYIARMTAEVLFSCCSLFV